MFCVGFTRFKNTGYQRSIHTRGVNGCKSARAFVERVLLVVRGGYGCGSVMRHWMEGSVSECVVLCIYLYVNFLCFVCHFFYESVCRHLCECVCGVNACLCICVI